MIGLFSAMAVVCWAMFGLLPALLLSQAVAGAVALIFLLPACWAPGRRMLAIRLVAVSALLGPAGCFLAVGLLVRREQRLQTTGPAEVSAPNTSAEHE